MTSHATLVAIAMTFSALQHFTGRLWCLRNEARQRRLDVLAVARKGAGVGREGTRFAVRAPIENSSIPGKQQQEYVERAAFFSLVPSKGRPDSFGNQPLFTMHYHQSVLCPATKQISAVTTVFDKQWRFKKAYLMSLIFKSNMQIDCSDHIWQHCPAQL